MAKSPVKLSVVHPGGVSTNIVRNSRTGTGMTDNARRAQSIERFDAVAKTTPAAAALRIIAGIEKNAPRILIGNDARMMDLLQRLRPATYWAVLARRIEKAMAKAGGSRLRVASTRTQIATRIGAESSATAVRSLSRPCGGGWGGGSHEHRHQPLPTPALPASGRGGRPPRPRICASGFELCKQPKTSLRANGSRECAPMTGLRLDNHRLELDVFGNGNALMRAARAQRADYRLPQ